jgi:hypothetical protein
MAKGQPFMKFFGEDWFTSDAVMDMSLAGQYAYLRMVWVQHTRGSCPDDPQQVALLTAGRLAWIKRGWKEARAMFEEDENGLLVNLKAVEKSQPTRGRPVTKDDPGAEARRAKDRERKRRQNGAEKGAENTAEKIDFPRGKDRLEKEEEKEEDIPQTPFPGFGAENSPPDSPLPWWDGHGLDDPHGLLASPKNDAWAIASLTLLAVAAKLDADPPTAEEVKRFLAKSSPLQALVRHYSATTDGPPDFREGCRKASLLAAWSMQADYQPNDWARIASQRAALEAKMRDDKRKTSGRSAAEIRDQIDLAPLEEILHQ